MDKNILTTIIMSLVLLAAIIFTYSNLKTAIGTGTDGSARQAAAGGDVVVRGTGTNVTHIGPTIACNPMSGGTKVDAAIGGGANGNKIKGTANCALTGDLATTTVTDPGGAAAFGTGNGNPGQGQATCKTAYTSAGAPDSAWVVVCSF